MTYLEHIIKTAEAIAESSVPPIDNQEIGGGEHKKSWQDSRDTLSELFSGFAAASKSESAGIKKAFPHHKHEVSSSPLLKLASHNYLEAMRLSFLAELEKIADSSYMSPQAKAESTIRVADVLNKPPADSLRSARAALAGKWSSKLPPRHPAWRALMTMG